MNRLTIRDISVTSGSTGGNGFLESGTCVVTVNYNAHNVRVCMYACGLYVLSQFLKPWLHRASASGLMLAQCLRIGMILTLGVGCTGTNQCEPLQVSMLTISVARALVGNKIDTFS